MKKIFRLVFHPVPSLEQKDTSLRYTDILFGFVIRELFLRLQNWPKLNWPVRLHLIVGATLVLGSWMGFRNSLQRSGYQAKFFNLPLFRFLLDQLMLILYFRVAVLTSSDATKLPPTDELAKHTTMLVLYVFILYVLWDILGIRMGKARMTDSDDKNTLRYPDHKISWPGFWISVGGLISLFLLYSLAGCLTPNKLLLFTTALLLAYRWAKEIRTSWQSVPRA